MSSTAHDELVAAVREWLAAEDDWALGTGRGHPPEVESERAQCALSKAGRVLDVLRTHHPLRPAPAPVQRCSTCARWNTSRNCPVRSTRGPGWYCADWEERFIDGEGVDHE